MKPRSLVRSAITASALVAATFLVTRAVYSQDQGPSPEDLAKFMAERAALADEHKRLADMAGTWDGEVFFWMAPGEPQKSKGTMTCRPALGGRILLGEWKGEFMGKPFEGLAIDGYDKDKKKNYTLWFDTAGTGFERFLGDPLKDGAMALMGEESECFGMKFTPRETVRIVDKDHHVMERFSNYGPPMGEMKEMEIRFTRRGAGPFPGPAPAAGPAPGAAPAPDAPPK